MCGGDLQPDDIWLKKGNSGWYTLSVCPACAGTGNEVGKGVFQRYKLARRDGLHWSFARCAQMPDAESLARWERMRAQQIERMQARAEKAAAEARKNAPTAGRTASEKERGQLEKQLYRARATGDGYAQIRFRTLLEQNREALEKLIPKQ